LHLLLEQEHSPDNHNQEDNMFVLKNTSIWTSVCWFGKLGCSMSKRKWFGNTLNNIVLWRISVCIKNMHTEINLEFVPISPTTVIRQPLYGLTGFFQKKE
jgi:hypothetical protein